MKKTTLMMALFAALAMVFTGCKDEEVPAIEYKTQGFIKGTLVGETSEGDDLNEKFTYSQYSGGLLSYYNVNETFEGEDFYNFQIEREDLNSGGYVLITFMLEELSSTSPINPQFIFNFRKETQDKIIFFDKNNFGNNDTEITNLSFDDKTGRLRGNFEVTSDNNSSGESAIITGEFDVVVKRAVE